MTIQTAGGFGGFIVGVTGIIKEIEDLQTTEEYKKIFEDSKKGGV